MTAKIINLAEFKAKCEFCNAERDKEIDRLFNELEELRLKYIDNKTGETNVPHER